MDEPLRDHDMYGHKITPIGEGFGVSISLGILTDGSVEPNLWVFHASDGFRQTLFSIMGNDKYPIANVFPDRLAEVLSLLKEQQ